SAPLRLNTAGSDADVRAFQLTPDGTRVVFLSDVEDDEVPTLYQVAIGGGLSQKLCPSLPLGREVLSRFVVRNDVTFYLSDRASDGVFELFTSAPPSLWSHSHSATAPTPTRSVTRGL